MQPCRTRKRRFHDHDGAKDALKAIRYRSRETIEHAPTRCYPCPFCKGWHLTSAEKE